MIAIIDYGVGNLFSLESSLKMTGAKTLVTSNPELIHMADHILLPGVGAFADAAQKLKDTGLDRVITDEAKSGKPLMGICLGMQLLFEKSFEYGVHDGLGLIPGEIRPISDVIPKDYKIPHIGWNCLQIKNSSCPIFGREVKDGDFVYFVHSYYAYTPDKYIAATTDYGAPITAAVSNGNITGCQFHPEKSGDTGLAILKAFCNII